MPNTTLDDIQRELKLLNANMTEANDIAILAAFAAIPPTLDDDSRRALKLLRDKIMGLAKTRTGV